MSRPEVPRYTWIQTRDGSPTLWSNEKGESFRSVKGAFTESWSAFIQPALQKTKEWQIPHLVVGEFGLGPGTNWLLWSLAAQSLGLDFEYFVIENDTRSFAMGLEEWPAQAEALQKFFAERSLEIQPVDVSTLTKPRIYSSLNEALVNEKQKAQIWFHDPFGYDVNPEGYSAENLQLCSQLWAPKFGVEPMPAIANSKTRSKPSTWGSASKLKTVHARV